MCEEAFDDNERIKKIRELQIAQLDLIKTFVEICEKEQLTYYMLGGTMLGAIRHKGYIPWDDDADFGMPRNDYGVFMKVAGKYLPEGERLSIFNGQDHCVFCTRLENIRKQVIMRGVVQEHVRNTWIDIFPLDGMPENRVIRALHKIRLWILEELFLLSDFDRQILLYRPHRTWYNRIGVFLCSNIPVRRIFSTSKIKRCLDKALMAYPYEKSTWNLNMMGAYKFKELFKQSVFGEGVFYEFEGMQLRGPKDYDFYLTQLYGDYMVPPSEAERNKHNTEVLESDNL